jgi:hypothetical protein
MSLDDEETKALYPLPLKEVKSIAPSTPSQNIYHPAFRKRDKIMRTPTKYEEMFQERNRKEDSIISSLRICKCVIL